MVKCGRSDQFLILLKLRIGIILLWSATAHWTWISILYQWKFSRDNLRCRMSGVIRVESKHTKKVQATKKLQTKVKQQSWSVSSEMESGMGFILKHFLDISVKIEHHRFPFRDWKRCSWTLKVMSTHTLMHIRILLHRCTWWPCYYLPRDSK